MTASPSDATPLPDAAARAVATSSFEPNIVVTAGAGTGKTALLVERALNLIGSGRQTLSSIAAITFTDKAAAELRQRLAAGLDDLRRLAAAADPVSAPGAATGDDGPQPAGEARRACAWLLDPERGGQLAGEVAARALAALQRIDAASVTTIHAFCAEILRRHPREAGVDPRFAIDEGPAAGRLFDEEWERFLEEETGHPAPRPEVWRRALGRPGALSMIRVMARALTGFATPARALREPAGPLPPALLAPLLTPLLASIDDILRRAVGMNPNMDTFLRSCTAYLAAALTAGPDAIEGVPAGWTIEEILGRKSTPAAGKKLAGVDSGIVLETAARARRLLRALAVTDDGAIESLLAAARPAAARCRERILQSGLVTFDGLLRLTRDLLAGHHDIRRALAARYGALLVDEFQDTDPLQYEILFYLAEEGGEPSADAWAARLAPGRLFIVGDPKQSIYRFRGADIEAYTRAVARVRDCGGTCVTLSTSFRSPAEIVEPINRLFGGWIGPRTPEEAISEPDYHPISPARATASDPDGGVTIWSIDRAGTVADRRRAEAEAIAAWIAERVASAPTGGARFRRYAILMRALTNAGLYVDALRRAGIPFVVEGGKNFYERREVGDLLSFLQAAANPGDGAAVLAVLRGPLGAVPDAELARFVTGGGRLDRLGAAAIGGDDFPNLRRATLLLDRFRERMPGRPADAIVAAALDETPLLLLHAACFDGGQRVANLRKLVTGARSLARQGLSLEEMLRDLEDRQEDRTEGESPLADETIDAVRVLTVHKAKGLEYDVVILPDLGRQPGGGGGAPETEVQVGRDPAGMAVRLSDGTRNTAWILHEEASRLHERAEEKRVFYVACTRARDQLILINSSRGGRAPWRDALAALGYSVDGDYPPDAPLGTGIEHRLLRPSRVSHAAVEPGPATLYREAADRWRETVTRLQAGTSPPLRWPTGAGDERVALDDDRPGDGERRQAGGGKGRDAARAAGVAIHAALQAWGFDDPGRLSELLGHEVRRMALEDDTGSRFADQVIGLGEEILRGFLASPLPDRLAGVRVLGREVPILLRDDQGTSWIGACDLIFEDAAGDVVVADYKTDRLEEEAPVVARRYHPQMSIYLQAVRRALPERRVRGEILFLRDGRTVPLD